MRPPSRGFIEKSSESSLLDLFPEKPRNILEIFNAPPTPLNQSDMFDIFLKFLKLPVDASQTKIPDLPGALPTHRGQLPGFYEPSIPTAIKIMESDIFYKGGLKGADNPGVGQLYESYPIKDLPVFVLSLASFLDMSSQARDAEWREKEVKKGFARVQSELSVLAPLVRRVKGQRPAGRLEKARQGLADLEKETLSAKTKIKLKPYGIKKVVAYFFKTLIDGPKDIRAERAAELLTAFGISTTYEGMREHFKRK